MGHTVKKGESLFKIAKRHGTSVQNLLKLNPQVRRNPNSIHPGEWIRVR